MHMQNQKLLSNQIGAATAVAQAGLEDCVIQDLGCLSSAAFLLYIKHHGINWPSLPAKSVIMLTGNSKGCNETHGRSSAV